MERLACHAIQRELDGQVEIGAASDLLLLSYAEQSASHRAEKLGGIAATLMLAMQPGINAKAAEAWQTLTGETVTLPSSEKVDFAVLAEAVHNSSGPLRFN